jgi:hypothetical protein
MTRRKWSAVVVLSLVVAGLVRCGASDAASGLIFTITRVALMYLGNADG